jgi:DHA2 family multidrug resistance protein-like MFS transporter
VAVPGTQASAASSAVGDGLPAPERGYAFAAVAIVLFLAVLDSAIANIVLPPITHDLGVRSVDAIWVVNGYQLAITMVLLPLASLGDIVGYRRVYLGGVALFTAASLVCALSPSLPALVAARAVQGLGAAGIMSVNIALIRFIYPRALLGRAVGNTALIIGASAAAGPTIAGLLLTVSPWQGLFLINVPIGLAALYVGRRTLPHTPRSGHAFDWASAALSAVTFGLVITGLNGVGDGRLLVAGAEILIGVAVGAIFVAYQRRVRAPILPLDLLARPVFALSAGTSVLSFAAQSLAFVSLPFLLHDTLGHSASEVGLLITPWPIATAAAAFVAGRLADWLHPGRLAAAGLALFTLGLLSLALLPSNPAIVDLFWRFVLTGLGFGLFQAPNNKVMISSAPRERSGGASGIQSTSRLVGQSIGVALFAVTFRFAPASHLQAALFLAATLSMLAIIPSLLRR